MLHVTNGDSAAGNLKIARVPGTVLPWRDILHEGPVPAGLTLEELSRVRAEYLAGLDGIAGFPGREPGDILTEFEERDRTLRGWKEHDEVVLWFEHDLYDQIQLIQLLAWFAGVKTGRTRLTMVCVEEYLGSLSPDAMAALLPLRAEVSPLEFELGARAWDAFTHADPTRIAGLLEEDTAALPFLAGALRRHLEQYPSTRNGLSRSESQALQVIAEGTRSPADVWVRSQQDLEERIFLGDWSFERMIGELSSGPEPIVRFEPGPLVAEKPGARFWGGALEPTEAGRRALAGTLDWVRVRGIDRWLGGVHLSGRESAWRWNAARDRIEPTV
jgi:uncharacterized protein DUF1835